MVDGCRRAGWCQMVGGHGWFRCARCQAGRSWSAWSSPATSPATVLSANAQVAGHPQSETMPDKHPIDRRGRHPNGVRAGTTMRGFAVRQIDRSPLVEQAQDRLFFPVEDPVNRMTARTTVREGALVAAASPTPQARPVDLEHITDPTGRPAGFDGVIDQAEQGCFHGLFNACEGSARSTRRRFSLTASRARRPVR